jgi:hypothetical protein
MALTRASDSLALSLFLLLRLGPLSRSSISLYLHNYYPEYGGRSSSEMSLDIYKITGLCNPEGSAFDRPPEPHTSRQL